ncbi:MAG: DUF484 family protein [Pseudohongiellaceae bacterium]
MSKDTSAVTPLESGKVAVDADQVAAYLESHPEFFIDRDDLLASLTLPHESGRAISLLERQVSILRNRGLDARHKLNHLLENARSNDQLFETVCNLVLALLESRDTAEIVAVTLEQLSHGDNIDACEMLLAESDTTTARSARSESEETLRLHFSEVFRLNHTYCGPLSAEATTLLFPAGADAIKSTAVCPVVRDGEIAALLVLGNATENYFNTTLDTLFLDFIGKVVGAVLQREKQN